MDAPKGRYRVEEKDGRLIVIDTATGESISSPGVAPPGTGSRSPGPIAAPGPPAFDRIARPLLRLVVNHWDDQGRAVIAWEWSENGRTKRWDAALDSAQQRRLARGLIAFAAFPAVIFLSILAGLESLWLLPIAVPATLWGVQSLRALQAETGGG